VVENIASATSWLWKCYRLYAVCWQRFNER